MPKFRSTSRQSAPRVDFDAVFWCYAHLDDPHVQCEDAATPGVWNMLLWAREARDRFYTSLFPKALAARAAAEWESESMDPCEELSSEERGECFQDFELERESLLIQGVPEPLIADAEALARDWGQAVGRPLSAECIAALTSHVASTIHAAAEAAAKNPEAFAKYLADWDGSDDGGEWSPGDPAGHGN